MSLTRPERAAGRVFRDSCQAELLRLHESDPPDLIPPPWVAHFRHNCEARGGRSTSFRLSEIYEHSPRYALCYCGEVLEYPETDDIWKPHPLQDHDCGPGELIQAGRLGFFYKQGKCSCGIIGRSRAGVLVDAWARPPLGRT
jgi:hypothetical protein